LSCCFFSIKLSHANSFETSCAESIFRRLPLYRCLAIAFCGLVSLANAQFSEGIPAFFQWDIAMNNFLKLYSIMVLVAINCPQGAP
jgi:hypothetical protein